MDKNIKKLSNKAEKATLDIKKEEVTYDEAQKLAKSKNITLTQAFDILKDAN